MRAKRGGVQPKVNKLTQNTFAKKGAGRSRNAITQNSTTRGPKSMPRSKSKKGRLSKKGEGT